MKQNLLVFDVDHIVEGNKGTIRLFCKDEKGKTILVLDSNFKPYFYVEPKEGKLNEYNKKLLDHKFEEGKILQVETIEKEYFSKKKKLLKIIVESPRDVYNIRQEVKDWSEDQEEYEYAISFYHRYLIDKQIKPMEWIEVEGETSKKEYQVDATIDTKTVKPIELNKDNKFRILAFDIEMTEENGEEKIIMISFVGNDGFKKVLTTWKEKNESKWVEILPDDKTMLERFVEIIKEQDPDFLVSYNGDNFDFQR